MLSANTVALFPTELFVDVLLFKTKKAQMLHYLNLETGLLMNEASAEFVCAV